MEKKRDRYATIEEMIFGDYEFVFGKNPLEEQAETDKGKTELPKAETETC